MRLMRLLALLVLVSLGTFAGCLRAIRRTVRGGGIQHRGARLGPSKSDLSRTFSDLTFSSWAERPPFANSVALDPEPPEHEAFLEPRTETINGENVHGGLLVGDEPAEGHMEESEESLLMLEALQVYRSVHGNLDVQPSFVVPCSSPWPSRSYGLELGLLVQSIRLGGPTLFNLSNKLKFSSTAGDPGHRSPDRIADDEAALSSAWSRMFEENPGSSDQWFAAPKSRERIAEALSIISHEAKDPSGLAIAQVHPFEGYFSPQQLGSILGGRIDPVVESTMKTTGYRFVEFGRFQWRHVAEALMAARATFGTIDVPPSFVITEDVLETCPKFASELCGMELGRFVHQIRAGDVDGLDDPDRKALLDALGFEWGDLSQHLHFRYPTMVMALRVHNHLYGHVVPQEDFVVPDAEHWPHWMVGAPVGQWVSLCRWQQQLLALKYPDRRALLDDMDFVWWIPPSPGLVAKFKRTPRGVT